MLNDGQQVKPYIAPNAPGLTLEAELGIGENAIPRLRFRRVGAQGDQTAIARTAQQPQLPCSRRSRAASSASTSKTSEPYTKRCAKWTCALRKQDDFRFSYYAQQRQTCSAKTFVALFSAGICYCSTRRRKAMQRPCETGSILRSNQSDKHTVGTGNVAEAKMLVKAARDIIIRIND